MKTNVSIELNAVQLNSLANLIDGKPTKRRATRKEIVDLCQQHISGLSYQTTTKPSEVSLQNTSYIRGDIYIIDPADRPLMAQPENPGYVRGWNLAKRALGAQK